MLGQMDYNVILGMDWLAAYHASVDIYKEKFFFYYYWGVLEFCFEADMPIISAKRAYWLSRQGYLDF